MRTWPIWFAGWLLLSATVHAQTHRVFGVGGHGAWVRPRDADRGVAYFGGHIRLRPLTWLMLEGAVDYRRETYLNDTVTAENFPVTVSAFLMLIPSGPVQLYLLGGGGIRFTQMQGAISGSSRSAWSYHAGAGVQVVLGAITLFGEYRYLGVRMDVQLTSTASSVQLDASGSSIRVGLTFWP